MILFPKQPNSEASFYTRYFMYKNPSNPKEYFIYMVFFNKPKKIDIKEPGWNIPDQGKPLVFRMFQGLTFTQASSIIGFLLNL